MVGLIDIAPATEIVQAQGKPVTVNGVSAKGLAHLLARFPELRRLMTGQEVQADQLLALGGDAVAAIIAAGCGYPGDVQQKQSPVVFRSSSRPICSPLSYVSLCRGASALSSKADGTRDLTRRRRRSIRYGGGYEIAEAIDALIVWMMTPRQIAGSLYFARRRRQRERRSSFRSEPSRLGANRGR